MAGVVRSFKIYIREKSGVEIDASSPLLPWLVRHVGWCGPPVPPLRRLLAEVARRGPALGGVEELKPQGTCCLGPAAKTGVVLRG